MVDRPDRPILVTGANGFLGRRVVRALIDADRPVRVLVRSAPVDSAVASAEVVLGDIRDPAAVLKAVRGCRSVVHLAAALRDEPDSEDVNVGGARHLIAACRQEEVPRVVVVSTQSARIPRKGAYGRTKAEADALFRASGLDVTVLHLSVVYGETGDGIFGTLHRFVRRLPVVPVLGNGRWRSAPVYVGDVASLLAQCAVRQGTPATDYDIGGPDQVSLDELLDRIGVACGVGIRPKLHVPFGLALAGARALAMVLPRPPVTVSNVLGSNQDTAMDLARAGYDLGFAPMSLADGLDRIFGTALHREARILGAYLLGTTVPEEIVDRYVEAHRRLLRDSAPDQVTAFALRHPRLIGALDAAGALVRTRDGLRDRLLMLAAILEASVETTDRFLPQSRSRAASIATLLGVGVIAVARALIGFPLRRFLLARGGAA